jgi:zinc and cadmium transporter
LPDGITLLESRIGPRRTSCFPSIAFRRTALMLIAWLLTAYCVLIVAASVGGGWLPTLVRMTHLRTQLLMSFVAGLMLGIATLHLLPHSFEWIESKSQVGASMLVGVLLMFVLLRVFHVHAHGEVPVATDAPQSHDGGADLPIELGGTPAEASHSGCGHGGAHHDHDHDHDHAHDHAQHRSLNWIGMFFGLGLHTVMDGVALGASVAADAGHGAWLGLAGLGTFLAVALHKPLDAFAIGSVMTSGGWSPTQRALVNLAFSLCCPLGAAIFYLGVMHWGLGEQVLGYGLALSAGFFVCIALADLLPEVQFHDHDRFKLTTALALGILLAIGIESLPGHSHDHPEHEHPEHEHAGHEHETVSALRLPIADRLPTPLSAAEFASDTGGAAR